MKDKLSENKDDYALGREIERSWLIRGEYDKDYEPKIAHLIFGSGVLVSIDLDFLLNALDLW